jgi:hypothetical protein
VVYVGQNGTAVRESLTLIPVNANRPAMEQSKQHRHQKRKTVQRRNWRPSFLEKLSTVGNVLVACEQSGVDRQIVYKIRAREPKFRADWESAIQKSNDRLELAARSRAVNGVKEPIWMKGADGNPIKVDEVSRYSDTLLIFLLKNNWPEKYREVYRQEHSGVNGEPLGPLVVNLVNGKTDAEG